MGAQWEKQNVLARPVAVAETRKRQNYGTGYLWPCSAAWRENVQARRGEGGPPGSPGLGSELWTHEHSHTHT